MPELPAPLEHAAHITHEEPGLEVSELFDDPAEFGFEPEPPNPTDQLEP